MYPIATLARHGSDAQTAEARREIDEARFEKLLILSYSDMRARRRAPAEKRGIPIE